MPNYRKPAGESDSLELLLDTMCNTFGGIMFIAIALFILSSFLSIKSMSPAGQNEAETIESIKLQAETIEQQIRELKRKIEFKQQAIDGLSSSPRDILAKEISQLQASSLELDQKILQKEKSIQENEAEYRLLLSKSETLNNDILNDDKEASRLKAEIVRLKDEYDLAVKSDDKLQHRKLTFKKLEHTYRSPYWVILKNNTLFRISKDHNEVTYIQVPGGGHCYYPVEGKGLKTSSNEISRFLDSWLFKKEFFLSLFVFPDSLPSLISIINEIERRGVKFYWIPVTDDSDCELFPITPDTIFKTQ